MTTITTVGYGDISARTFNEKIVCIFIMLSGVIAFSMASSSLTNYIAQEDAKSEQYIKKLEVLDRLFDEHRFTHQLYRRIKKNIEANTIEDKGSVNKFVEDLPINLRKPLSIAIYKDVYSSMDFMKKKSAEFISWLCPLLKLRIATQDEVVYYEGDALDHVYFLKNGCCNYVLPKYGNRAFLKIVKET